MNIPAELVVWLLGANGLFLSFCVHLLITLNGKMSKICTSHEVEQTRTDERLAAMKRHMDRNEAETRMLQRHLNINPQPHSH